MITINKTTSILSMRFWCVEGESVLAEVEVYIVVYLVDQLEFPF